MKQLYTLLLMLPAMLFAQTDIDFQSISSGLPGPSWTWTADQPDTSFDVVDNPYATGINTSSKVGELTAAAGSNAWALAFSDGIGSFSLDANNTTVKIMVYKTRISPVQIKFEDAADSSISVSKTVSNTVVNAWEELTFDFYSEIAATSYGKIVIIPDNSTRTEANITYIDNITFTEGVASVGPTIALPVDFEEAIDAYAVEGFDGGVASIEAGPDGANSLKYIKGAGQNWAGVKITLDTAVDGANGEVITASVHSTVARDITLKFDVANVERKVSHGGTGWEAMSFDFTGALPANQTVIAFFNDLTQQGDGSADWTIYIDNLAQTTGGNAGPTIALPVDFEEAADAYVVVGFDGGVATVEAGPDNANSLKYVKGAGQNWAGVKITLDTAVDGANGEVITASVHSTVARDITLKFDVANVERKVSHGGTGWEAMSFDFTGALPANQTVIAFFNDLTQQGDGSADWTIYIDNLAQTTGGNAGPTIALPVDFEEAADAYVVVGFDGGVATVEAGPDNANSLKYVKGAGQNWAGVKITLDTAVDGADGQIITADVHSTVARDITLKFDVANVERKVSHGGTGWEAMSFDFTGAMPANQTVIAFFNDLTQPGDGSADWTIYIDNLAQTGDGVTTPAGPTDAPSTPPARNSWDVISVYGEAYGTAIGLNNTDWDTSTFADETIAGNVVLKAELAGGDYIGADLGSKIDASEMTHFHIDYWIGGDLLVGQTMNTKWSNHAGGNDQTSSFQDYNTGPQTGTWKSRDIDIEALTGDGNGDFSRAELAQLIVTLSAAGGTYPSVIYIDNVYFYRAATASINDLESNVNVYPNPVENTLNVSAAVVIDAVSIYDLTGREVMRAKPNATAFSLDVADLNKGLYLVTVTAGKQELTTKLVK